MPVKIGPERQVFPFYRSRWPRAGSMPALVRHQMSAPTISCCRRAQRLGYRRAATAIPAKVPQRRGALRTTARYTCGKRQVTPSVQSRCLRHQTNDAAVMHGAPHPKEIRAIAVNGQAVVELDFVQAHGLGIHFGVLIARVVIRLGPVTFHTQHQQRSRSHKHR